MYLNNTMVTLTWWGRVALFALCILLHTGKVLYADYPTSDLRSEPEEQNSHQRPRPLVCSTDASTPGVFLQSNDPKILAPHCSWAFG